MSVKISKKSTESVIRGMPVSREGGPPVLKARGISLYIAKFMKKKIRLHVAVDGNVGLLDYFACSNGITICVRRATKADRCRWDSKKKTLYLFGGGSFSVCIARETYDLILGAFTEYAESTRVSVESTPHRLIRLDDELRVLEDQFVPSSTYELGVGLDNSKSGFLENALLDFTGNRRVQEDERLKFKEGLKTELETALSLSVSACISSFLEGHLSQFSGVPVPDPDVPLRAFLAGKYSNFTGKIDYAGNVVEVENADFELKNSQIILEGRF